MPSSKPTLALLAVVAATCGEEEVEAKTYGGTFSAVWWYEDPAHEMGGSFVSFGDCGNEALGANPK